MEMKKMVLIQKEIIETMRLYLHRAMLCQCSSCRLCCAPQF